MPVIQTLSAPTLCYHEPPWLNFLCNSLASVPTVPGAHMSCLIIISIIIKELSQYFDLCVRSYPSYFKEFTRHALCNILQRGGHAHLLDSWLTSELLWPHLVSCKGTLSYVIDQQIFPKVQRWCISWGLIKLVLTPVYLSINIKYIYKYIVYKCLLFTDSPRV